MSMEWHFGCNIDDFAVPKDEEIFNQFPSPDSWSPWGKRIRNFNSPEKVTVSGVEEIFHPGISFCSEFEELVAPLVDQDARHAFHQWNACPLEHSDPQLNDIALINEADDIFFQSLFEDVTDIDGDETSPQFTQTSSNDIVISVSQSLFEDIADIDGAETSPQFTQTSSNDTVISASLSGEWNHNCANNAANFGPPPTKFKEPEFGIYVAEEHSNDCDDMCENKPMEESVLMELQRSTLQLTKKTRLCFRDSLYRLAEDSRHHTKYSQSGRESSKNRKTTSKRPLSRSQQSKAKSQGTNAIDRTVATLLFNLPASLSANYLPERAPEQESQDNSDMFQPTSSTSRLCSPSQHDDAEVPTFALMDQTLPPQRGHYTYSSTTYPTQA